MLKTYLTRCDDQGSGRDGCGGIWLQSEDEEVENGHSYTVPDLPGVVDDSTYPVLTALLVSVFMALLTRFTLLRTLT